MNQKQMKEIRRYVRKEFPFMSQTPIYEVDDFGTRRLAPVCQRAFSQNIKRNYKKWRKSA